MFGTTQSVLSAFLRFGKVILYHILKKEDDAKICLPTQDEFESYVHHISIRHPELGKKGVVHHGRY